MSATTSISTVSDILNDRWTALRARDQTADGHFFYSVRSTGVYCYPSCSSLPPLLENVAFHDTRQQAEATGFRPCKRCRPDLPPRAEHEALLVAQACRMIEGMDSMLSLTELAKAVGSSPHHFHRLFKRVTGVTPKSYGDAYRAGGRGETIQYSVEQCSLGYVLVGMSSRGVCAILMGDNPESLVQDLGERFPKADLEATKASLRDVLGRVVQLIDNPLRYNNKSLPLDIRGTAFQQQVWNALRQIPAGETVSYAELAAKIGLPNGARAVASACAANSLAVAVPCHRVIAASGNISGYHWGVKRKKYLLEIERA